jgi:hypothetical protein
VLSTQEELEVLTESGDLESQVSGPIEAPEPADADYEVRLFLGTFVSTEHKCCIAYDGRVAAFFTGRSFLL